MVSYDSIMGRVAEKIGSVKDKTWQKVEDFNTQIDMQAQYRFVQAVAKDEGVTYEVAVDMCTVGTDSWQPKYSLGYKLQAPHVTVMLKSKRGQAAIPEYLHLTPEELKIYREEVLPMKISDIWRAEEKKQKRAKKEAKKEGRQRAVGLRK